ncbi:MAG TPA: serine/threonine-protein kinase [Kofleriaceae bacterium]|nr:serine/threonine-protein kinase [Kofleriaceae bacterium]
MSTSAAPGRAAPSLQSAATLPTEVAMPAPTAAGAPEPRRRICDRLSPASASSSSSSLGLGLPSDLVAEAGRRLSLAMLVVAAVDLVYVVLFLTVWSEYSDLVGQVVGGSALVVSLVGAYMLRSCPRTQREIVLVAALYEVGITFGFSLVEYWHLPDYRHVSQMISWTCLIIAFFPVLVPGRVRQVAIASTCAAAANTLAFVFAFPVRGQPMLDPDVTASLLLPPYIAAALSLIPARVVNRLGRQVSQARQLGSYSLVERLGAGGMGEVWRAEHRLLARPAAIKLIKLDAGSDPQDRTRVVERFEREAQATAALESPHTVELYDFGVADDGTFFYVMELLRGIDLERLVSRHGPQPPERVAHILAQACDSLADAHARGLVHRDIKPANILVTSRARAVDYVKVLDFGLVKLIRQAPDEVKLSRAGEVHGTPAYMAPEEAVGDGELDGRADLYSLGCVAYWLLTGKLLFDEPSSMKMALAHATREPVPPSRVASQAIPPELEALVMRCLAKSPAERPASAQELSRELARGGWARAWTAERAEAWWRENLPDRLPPEAPVRLATSVQFSIDRAG